MIAKEIQPLIDEFIQMKIDRNQISDAQSFKVSLKTFLDFMKNKPYIKEIAQIDRKDIEEYREHLESIEYEHNQAYRPSYIYRRMRALRKFFDYLIVIEEEIDNKFIPKAGLIKKSDFPAPNRRSSKHFPIWFDNLIIEQIRVIPEDFENIQFKTILMFFYYTGVRNYDLCTLEADCIMHKYDKPWVKIFANKVKRYYEIPLNNELYEMLLKYKKAYKDLLQEQQEQLHPTLKIKCKYIFSLSNTPTIYKDQNSRKIKAFNESIYNIAKQRGYPCEELEGLSLTTHKFRHNIGIKLTRMGADPLLVAEFLGHKNLSMAQAYIQENEGYISDILNNIEDDESLEIQSLDENGEILILEKSDLLAYNDVVSKATTGWCTHFNGNTMCDSNPYQCWLCENLKPDKENKQYLKYLYEQLEIHKELSDRNKKLGFIEAHNTEEKIIKRITIFIREVNELNG